VQDAVTAQCWCRLMIVDQIGTACDRLDWQQRVLAAWYERMELASSTSSCVLDLMLTPRTHDTQAAR
jgi:hypothetical protein